MGQRHRDRARRARQPTPAGRRPSGQRRGRRKALQRAASAGLQETPGKPRQRRGRRTATPRRQAGSRQRAQGAATGTTATATTCLGAIAAPVDFPAKRPFARLCKSHAPCSSGCSFFSSSAAAKASRYGGRSPILEESWGRFSVRGYPLFCAGPRKTADIPGANLQSSLAYPLQLGAGATMDLYRAEKVEIVADKSSKRKQSHQPTRHARHTDAIGNFKSRR